MKKIFILLLGCATVILVFNYSKKLYFNATYTVGEVMDSLNHVKVYYNGGVDHVLERNVTADGYNLGLKYQCVEFVKRYYHDHYHHKMPDSYGHAKDFFDKSLGDGQMNEQRDLLQFSNKILLKPEVGDLLVFDGTIWNRFGHVAIISGVAEKHVEIIQQNPGPFSKTREVFPLSIKEGKYQIEHKELLGWLRINKNKTAPVPEASKAGMAAY